MKYNNENYSMDEIGTQFGGFSGCIIWTPIMILIFWIPIILLAIWMLYQ